MTDLERYEPQAPMSGNPAHVRLSIDDVGRVSKIIEASGLWRTRAKNPTTGRWDDRPYTQAECWAIVMAGQSMGVAPIPAMSSFHMIEGRAEMSANLQAYFLKSSGRYDYRREFEYDDDDTATACVITVFDTTSGEAIGTSRYTMKKAQKAGLIRSGGNWEKHPEPMLFARAISDAVAQITPDAVPMRIYGEGEISGQEPSLEPEGVSAVAGEGPPSTTRVEAAVSAALDASMALDEEEIQDAEVVGDETAAVLSQLTNDQIERATQAVRMPAEAVANPRDVETQARKDVPELPDEVRPLIKQAVVSVGEEFAYSSMVKVMMKAGFTDVRKWAATLVGASEQRQAARTAPEPTQVAENVSGAPAGLSGRSTGSQTSPTISDSQVRMFNARCSDANLTEAERKAFMARYAGVDSSRQIAKKDLDELLQVLADIQMGDEATRRAYLSEES